MKQRFEDYRQYIETEIKKTHYGNRPAELYEPIGYMMSLGGKRLRPALVLAGAELFGQKKSEAIKAALAIEVFHNFTLVHDDIMDQANLRRNQPTVHRKWNESTAILSGDAMMIKAYQYLCELDSGILPTVLDTFSQTALEICEGQQLDMVFESRNTVKEKEYIEMIKLKTAVLLGASLKIGALIGGARPSPSQALYDFGVYAGTAFQIQDDWLDAFGAPEKVGKKPGGDIIQGKKTLLSIKARELDPAQFKELSDHNWSSENEKIEAFRMLFTESGARSYIENQREEYLRKALNALDSIKAIDTELSEELKQFAIWLSHRDY